MVEIGEGEVIFGSPKLDVTLLADVDQLAVVEVRAAPGWGGTALHVHARHAEAVFVIEGKVDLRLEDAEAVVRLLAADLDARDVASERTGLAGLKNERFHRIPL